MKVFVFHGAYGSPEENWIPWLRKEIEGRGHQVFVPRFPTPEKQNLENWKQVFIKIKGEVDEESVFVGHSLGAVFALRVIEKLDKPVKACFLVAGFTGDLGIEEFDSINHSFTDKKFNWEKIKSNCRRFVVFYSDNDQYVPMEKGKELARRLSAETALVKNAGHFNKESRFTEFPQLLEKIQENT